MLSERCVATPWNDQGRLWRSVQHLQHYKQLGIQFICPMIEDCRLIIFLSEKILIMQSAQWQIAPAGFFSHGGGKLGRTVYLRTPCGKAFQIVRRVHVRFE